MNLGIALLFLLFLLASHISSTSAIAQEQCLERGFNPQVLLCSTCEHVQKVLGQQEVYDDCRSCCIEKQEEVYEKAVLQMDKRYLPYYREMQDVIEQKESLRLKVKFLSGNPMLLMYTKKDDTEAADTISVGTWRLDTFKEYLATHLISKQKRSSS